MAYIIADVMSTAKLAITDHSNNSHEYIRITSTLLRGQLAQTPAGVDGVDLRGSTTATVR
jgi:hypothetical protein